MLQNEFNAHVLIMFVHIYMNVDPFCLNQVKTQLNHQFKWEVTNVC